MVLSLETVFDTIINSHQLLGKLYTITTYLNENVFIICTEINFSPNSLLKFIVIIFFISTTVKIEKMV